jgi:hypothetical protein
MPETTSLTKHRVQVLWPSPTRPEVEADGGTFQIAKVTLEYQRTNGGRWKVVSIEAAGQMFSSERRPIGHGVIDYRYHDKPELIAGLITEHRP